MCLYMYMYLSTTGEYVYYICISLPGVLLQVTNLLAKSVSHYLEVSDTIRGFKNAENTSVGW